jgi:hypothetical protein
LIPFNAIYPTSFISVRILVGYLNKSICSGDGELFFALPGGGSPCQILLALTQRPQDGHCTVTVASAQTSWRLQRLQTKRTIWFFFIFIALFCIRSRIPH